MERKDIEEKILKHHKELTDDQWIKLYEESKKLDDFMDFKESLAGHYLGQMISIIQYKKNI